MLSLHSSTLFSGGRPICPYEDRGHFELLKRVVEVIFEHSDETQTRPWIQNLCYERPNTKGNLRMHTGFLLELYYFMPHTLWTAWGVWTFAGSGGGDWVEHIKPLLERFRAEFWREEETDEETGVQRGPWYALYTVDDIQLPDPEFPREELHYTEANRIKAVWEQFSKGVYDAPNDDDDGDFISDGEASDIQSD